MDKPSALVIRKAVPADVGLVHSFIRELAVYEKMLDDFVATEQQIEEALFGEKPVVEVILAAWRGEPAGYALYFHNFSTFLGRSGIYLEDLFVRSSLRGNGIGKGLLEHLAATAVERGCGRVEWSVLDWNEPAIQFYRALGAKPVAGWTVFRLTGDSLRALGEGAGSVD